MSTTQKDVNGLLHGSPPTPQPHFVLVPFLAQGHIIPIVDLAHLLANRGAFVTVITTPLNASRLGNIIESAKELQLLIKFLILPFDCCQFGLPEGSENFDTLPSELNEINPFLEACMQLRDPLILYLKEHGPPPNCVISDFLQPWTGEVARIFGIPRFSFVGICAFCHLCSYVISSKNIYDKVVDAHEPVPLPGFPHPLAISKNQSPSIMSLNEKFRHMIREENSKARGMVVNTFQELESLYLDSLKNAIKMEVWALGPMGLYNRDAKQLNSRGNKASIDIDRCLKWLDGMQDWSVIYISFGSIACSTRLQLIEIGLGLEASKKPFMWVIKAGDRTSEFEQWMLDEGFEERTKDRGLIIRGWAPQMVILSHDAIGCFMTHCGWNSVVEGISSGVPMITWPHFADQFVNEMLVVDVLKIGVRIGVTSPTFRSNKSDEVKVTRDDVARKVSELINDKEEGMERRVKARELGKVAKKAMEEGGSSYQNIGLLINEIRQQMLVSDAENESGMT